MQTQPETYNLPDATGHFGPYGGIFVAETLQAALHELKMEYESARADPAFIAEIQYELKHYVVGQARFITPADFPMNWVARRFTSNARISIIPAHIR